jgi:hypothetical protein
MLAASSSAKTTCCMMTTAVAPNTRKISRCRCVRCAVCSAPVPTPRGTLPDLAVGAHIDRDCKSKPREKVFTNRCNRAKCKKRELVPVICDACRLNYCLAHRHPQDHECQGPQAVNRRRLDHFAAASATASVTSGPPARSSGGQSKLTDFFRGSQPTPRSFAAASANSTAPRAAAAAAMVNGMSEDEALAAAMAASLQDVNQQQLAVRGVGSSGGQSSRHMLTQEEEDRQLFSLYNNYTCVSSINRNLM